MAACQPALDCRHITPPPPPPRVPAAVCPQLLSRQQHPQQPLPGGLGPCVWLAAKHGAVLRLLVRVSRRARAQGCWCMAAVLLACVLLAVPNQREDGAAGSTGPSPLLAAEAPPSPPQSGRIPCSYCEPCREQNGCPSGTCTMLDGASNCYANLNYLCETTTTDPAIASCCSEYGCIVGCYDEIS